jgi:hypothetical protein
MKNNALTPSKDERRGKQTRRNKMIEPDEPTSVCRHLNDPDDCPYCEQDGRDDEVDEETLIDDRRAALAELDSSQAEDASDAAYFASVDATYFANK